MGGLFRTETGDFSGRTRSATLPARWSRPCGRRMAKIASPWVITRGEAEPTRVNPVFSVATRGVRSEPSISSNVGCEARSRRHGRHRIARRISTRRRALPEHREKRSAGVTERSNALDLEANVFALDDPAAIARSLKRSAEASERRKAPPFRSATSMLVFYINRAGKDCPISAGAYWSAPRTNCAERSSAYSRGRK